MIANLREKLLEFCVGLCGFLALGALAIGAPAAGRVTIELSQFAFGPTGARFGRHFTSASEALTANCPGDRGAAHSSLHAAGTKSGT